MRRFASIVLLAGLATTLAAEPPPEGARECVKRFGEALERGDTAALRALLPERGKIRLNLDKLGPSVADASAGQVEAIFAAFLEHGAVREFEIASPERPGEGYSLIRAKATVVDRAGMASAVELHLSVESEDDRWVLRDIRESRR